MKRLAAALLVLACLCGAAAAETQLPEMRLHQIANGHTANYLITAGGTVILVDCGLDTDDPGASSDRMFAYLEAVGIDHVDAHIVTHWHNDHAYNVPALNRLYGTADTVVYGVSAELPARFAPLANGVYRQMSDGGRIAVGPVEILCVGPEAGERTGEQNRDSLNFIVFWGAHRFLFTGDWFDYTVARRHREEIDRIDVLCFPHHGLSPMAVRAETMRILSPRVILIPGSGQNEDAVKDFIFHACNVKVMPRFYSNRDGNAQVISDGVNLFTAYGMAPGELPAGKPVK